MRITPQRDARGRPERFLIVERDITQDRRRRLAAERDQRMIRWAALHDGLTGLPNRRGFEEEMAWRAPRAAEHDHALGLLYIDLDRFMQVNDALGYAAGDAALRAIADRIQPFLGPDAFAARIGGDAFVVAVELQEAERDLRAYAERMLAAIVRPVAYESVECRFGASIGYAVNRAPPYDVSQLLVEAEIALYRAKVEGRNSVHPFTADLAASTRRRKTMSDELSVAIERQEFVTLYQPQIDAVTGDLAGMEALVRWQHPRLGLIGPGEFLPLAQDLSLEAEIDRLVLAMAHDDLARLRAAGLALPAVSVNVSTRRLFQRGLLDEPELGRFPPGTLNFELLESTFLDDHDEVLMWVLDALRERGTGIEIDDFGTGHASITGLLRVRPDKLKIDRALVTPATEDVTSRRVLELIVDMGRTLAIGVIAEGIESEAHADLARTLGIPVLQGYHYAPPLSAAEIQARYAPGAEALAQAG